MWGSEVIQIKLLLLISAWTYVFLKIHFFKFDVFWLFLLLVFLFTYAVWDRNFICFVYFVSWLIKWWQMLLLRRLCFLLLSLRRNRFLRWRSVLLQISFDFVVILFCINSDHNYIFVFVRRLLFPLSLRFLLFLNNIFRLLLSSTIKYRPRTNSKFHRIQFRLYFSHISLHQVKSFLMFSFSFGFVIRYEFYLLS